MWSVSSNFKSDNCWSLCREGRPMPVNPHEDAWKEVSGSLRANLPKLVTQLWDSEPASKVQFDRPSPPPHPHPNRASINLGRTFPRSWSCVHISCQLVATGGKQKVKGRADHPDSVEEAWPTQRGEEAQRPRPRSLHTLPPTCHGLPQKAFSAVVSNLGERLQNEVAHWLTTTEGERVWNKEE